ncbi:hypothetical protein [Priestia endophytica]|uniref:Uncharacterized protein n=1 Tax=Priestia endophytica TaxID=135735 RepID=A0AAX1Q4B7_9BACI|nr:hypothetical protein [Priestia endophytica]RAS73514.1 hypothetical protein A3864_20530 [Priestia endophytica]RAS90682.1 hypothetical protein A3863_09520 [Priestia endophytica]
MLWLSLDENYVKRYAIIKTIADWTVWLYIFIPGMLFLIVFYLYYLGNTSPYFIHFMDKYLFFVFFFYLLWGKYALS